MSRTDVAAGTVVDDVSTVDGAGAVVVTTAVAAAEVLSVSVTSASITVGASPPPQAAMTASATHIDTTGRHRIGSS
jgi:hypothetical protein